jgi:hypothetical protein
VGAGAGAGAGEASAGEGAFEPRRGAGAGFVNDPNTATPTSAAMTNPDSSQSLARSALPADSPAFAGLAFANPPAKAERTRARALASGSVPVRVALSKRASV